MVIWRPLVVIVALPDVTSAPVGSVPGSRANTGTPAAIIDESRAKERSRERETLPFDLTFSETTIHLSLDLDQMMLNILFMISPCTAKS